MIRARDVTLSVDSKVLVRDVAFDVEAGEIIAVLGRNGVGKTTLLRAIAGVRAPKSGSVTIGGRDMAKISPAQRARTVAHVAGDDLFLDRLTVRDVVSMGRYPHHEWWQWREEPRDRTSIDAALQAVHMQAFAERRFDTLSSGERQRIWLALALAQEARVLLLDEPTSHLDIGVAREILRLLRAQAREDRTVVCVLHDVNEAAEFADKILLLGSQRLLAFDVPERALTPALLQQAYGIDMECLRTEDGGFRVFPVSLR